MRFGVLGPVTVTTGTGPVALGSAKRRALLALLLAYDGRPVPHDRLADAVWGENPPPAYRDTLRWHLHQVRRVLGEKDRITSTPAGYAITIGPGELDAALFQDLYDQALRAEPDSALGLLDEALALWRGPAYADAADIVPQAVARLEDLRLAALEKRMELGLEAGHHTRLVPELRSLTAEHPFREPFHAQLMLALYRAGRQADALQVYADLRDVLRAELGTAPGPKLQRLHQAILSTDAALDASPSVAAAPGPAVPDPPVPSLPPDAASFTGRSFELVRLRDHLTARSDRVVIASVAGPGGVGKSALAVHCAHQLAERFPDGRLYLDLRGSTPGAQPLETAEALAILLRSLGVTNAPVDPDEAAARFRSATDGKSLLFVLDNAADSARVRPLIPGCAKSAVLVTSRRPLTAVDGSVHIQLGVLRPEEAGWLFANLIGASRAAAEPAEAAEIIELCGRLPLAIRIAATRLTTHPSWRLALLAERLREETSRLSELQADDLAIRACFNLSHQELGGAEQRMFRLAGLLNGQDMDVGTAAALADRSPREAGDLMDHLVDVQLAEAAAHDRYRMHDLLRLFSRERAMSEEPEAGRENAILRALHHHLAGARTASRILDPASDFRVRLGPATDRPGRAMCGAKEVNAWIDSECDNLVAAVEQAVHHDPATAVGLAAALRFPLYQRGRWRAQQTIAQACLQAAERTRDPAHLAIAKDDLGRSHVATGAPETALGLFTEALGLWRRVGIELAEGQTLRALAFVHNQLGRPRDGLEPGRRSLTILNRLGDQRGEASAWMTLAYCHARLGDLAAAVEAHEKAYGLIVGLDQPYWTAYALGDLGAIHHRIGRFGEALGYFRRALEIDETEGYGATYLHAEHLWGLAATLDDLGDAAEARAGRRRSAAILQRLGLITAEEHRRIDTTDHPQTPEAITRHF